MKFRLLLLSFVTLFVTTAALAQNEPQLSFCGTQDGKVSWLEYYQQHRDEFPESGQQLTVPLTIHIVGDDNGAGYFGIQNLLNALCTLNEDFEASSVRFFIAGNIRYINKTKYYDHTFSDGAKMMNQNNVANTINCYFVSSPAGNCGYSSYNKGIALAKSCMGANDHTWAHELGHFLSLPHTFYGWEGYTHDFSQPAPYMIDGHPVERVDGSNCTDAADGFCDTTPDYIADRWTCNSLGKSTLKQKDPAGNEFTSDGTLFMSYSSDACMTHFSEEQIQAMRSNLQTEKAGMLYTGPAIAPVEMTPLVPVTPLAGEILPGYQNVVFEWDTMPNATDYILEISPFQSFSFTQFSYHVAGNSFVCKELLSNRNYSWRVRPFNNWHGCNTLPSSISTFKTGVISAVETIEAITGLTVQPNPVRAGQQLQLNISSVETLLLDAQLTNVSGQTIQRFQWNLTPGNNRFYLSTEAIPAGIYFLQLRSEKGVVTERVVVGKS